MKYLAASLFSVIIFVGFVVKANFSAFFHTFLFNKRFNEEKEFHYRGLIIVWAVFTVAAFVFVIFFVD